MSNDDRYIYVTTTNPSKVLVFGTDPDTPSSYHLPANTIDVSEEDGRNAFYVQFHNSDDGFIHISTKLKVICQKDDVSAIAPVISSAPIKYTRVGDAPSYIYNIEVTDPDLNDIHRLPVVTRAGRNGSGCIYG